MSEIQGLNIVIPPIGTSAQDWARIMNQNFAIIDYHNHTINYGLQVPCTSLGFSDLNVNNQQVINVNYVTFVPTISGSDFPFAIFVNPTGDLVYENTLYSIPITSGSGLNISNLPDGFTVVGSPPIAIFDPSAIAIRFESSTGGNTSTVNVATLNCNTFNITGSFSITDLPASVLLVSNTLKSYFLGVTDAGNVITPILPSYNAWENSVLYKLSENGVFYYDNNSSPNYDLSYFLGSKNWISSPNRNKTNKVGVKYYMKTVSFPITGLTVDQTFILDSNLNNSNLVSFIPKIETATVSPIGQSNALLQSMTLPTFKILFTNTSLSVAVFLDFSSYTGLFTSLTISFKIIYANNSYTIEN